MDLLLQIQQIVDAPIKDLLIQLQTSLPDVDLSNLFTINGPENVGDLNFGSSFGDLNLGSSDFGSSDFGSSDFLNTNTGVVSVEGK
ncbi:hypothetical protein [Corynebacterium pelargi]|uniref:Uncharacterized protein n=1 Tax=Corynebacterium pelargi TaxID=1471400 RepID=A0A410W6J3_9CORY|nr:hypothetical protein [Corynebacterium pelargi]QAU51648.1 hypothetical protein CPELA_01745 [Corynebacterium pelargi]GGG80263.1 hypothetical protein GCM10007338_18410 [Corynebacterium pelargi]